MSQVEATTDAKDAKDVKAVDDKGKEETEAPSTVLASTKAPLTFEERKAALIQSLVLCAAKKLSTERAEVEQRTAKAAADSNQKFTTAMADIVNQGNIVDFVTAHRKTNSDNLASICHWMTLDLSEIDERFTFVQSAIDRMIRVIKDASTTLEMLVVQPPDKGFGTWSYIMH
jgi:dihydroxyacetone kinase